MQIQVGIITISDRASAGEYADLGGPALKKLADEYGWQVLSEAIVPDDAVRIQETIHSFSQQGCGLILTTGGTGIAERDVTPEAIRAIMRVELPGFGELMRAESMKITPNAFCRAAWQAIVDVSLVIALPGKQAARWNVLALSLARFHTRSHWRNGCRPRAEFCRAFPVNRKGSRLTQKRRQRQATHILDIDCNI